ncbi:MAG TPA: phasin family protein [Acetobacteraceae bacterium]|nr:phasin family protein [Acetobacteraceae bacterium]
MPDATNVRDTEAIGAETLASVAQAMAEIAQRAMSQGQEAWEFCFNSMTTAQAPVAATGYERGRRIMADGHAMLETYRQIVDRSMDDLQAYISAGASMSRGLLRAQRAYIDGLRNAVESWGDKPQALLRSTSPIEAARMQRELCLDALNGIVAYNLAALQALSQAAQDAMRPLHERAR